MTDTTETRKPTEAQKWSLRLLRASVPPPCFRGVAVRGSALVVILVGALVASVAAYSVLVLTTAQAHTTRFTRERTKARYLAEAGYVLATQRLLANPGWCGNSEFIDTNGDGVPAAPDPMVVITVSNCGAGNSHEITVRADYD